MFSQILKLVPRAGFEATERYAYGGATIELYATTFDSVRLRFANGAAKLYLMADQAACCHATELSPTASDAKSPYHDSRRSPLQALEMHLIYSSGSSGESGQTSMRSREAPIAINNPEPMIKIPPRSIEIVGISCQKR